MNHPNVNNNSPELNIDDPDKSLNSNKMTFLKHLEELHRCIIISISVWAVTCTVSWYLTTPAITYFKSFPHLKQIQFILIRPTEAFMVRLKIAIVLGFLLALPILLQQMLSFILPGLKKSERFWVLRFVPGSTFLFYLGGAFSLYVMLPLSLNFLLVSMSSGLATPQISLGEYVNLLIMMTILGGVIFQTPVILFFLVLIGIVSSDSLRKYRRHAILIIFIIAAIASPPDIVSQTIVAIPMLILFELSIWLAKIAGK
jgi:sec-independent protein translocase protein TatC